MTKRTFKPDPIVEQQRDILPFWEAVNAELDRCGHDEVLYADIRSLAELFDDPRNAARHEISCRTLRSEEAR